jgi:ArsR family transcriptional regulator, arsenate/arsenite/antimonite-responsive transcriptional repressor
VQGTAVTVDSQAKIFGALSDPVRLRFVRLLADGEERSGSDIAEALGISLALLCHHSKILVDAGVVIKRKEAQTARYKANRAILKQAMKDLLA